MMDKLKMHSLDGVARNIELIGNLFPSAVTEVMRDGKVERAIDFDVLRQELSDCIVEGREERYQFTWPDKKKAMLAANAPITATLRPVVADSVGRDGTPGGFDSENLYIEGDNLEVLKLLQETYLGKVKMIYIDPPYNTGNDFVYEDDFAQSTGEYMENSGQYDEAGNRMVTNTESNGRFHTDWLNMIYPRLRLAKDLLAEDGVIFISIDDNEAANLIKICEEVFGSSNNVADIAWQRTYAPRNDSKGISVEKEHLVVFSKTLGWIPNKLPRTAEMNAKYKNPDGDARLWRPDNPCAPGAASHQGMVYAIQHPFSGKMLYPSNGACWRYQQHDMLEIMKGWGNYELRDLHDDDMRASVCGVTPDNVRKGIMGIVLHDDIDTSRAFAQEVLSRGNWPIYYFTNNGNGGIAKKTYLNENNGKVVTNQWLHTEVGHSDEAKKELLALFDGEAPFDTPKPVRLIDRMLTVATDKDSLVLDFFSGSATTAHAVMAKNVADGGNRKFILVQLPERSDSPQYGTLCEIGKERIRRAGRKIKEEAGLTASADLDIGFRCLRLDESNMKPVYYTPGEMEQWDLFSQVDNVKPDRTPEDLLFQVMLDLGILLSSKIEETTIGGCKVFNVADGFLYACFDNNISDEVVTAIAKEQPYYAVFRDSGMASDSVLTNFDQIFASISSSTVRKVL